MLDLQHELHEANMEILALRGDLEQWTEREAELSSTTACSVSGLVAEVCVSVSVCMYLRLFVCADVRTSASFVIPFRHSAVHFSRAFFSYLWQLQQVIHIKHTRARARAHV